MMKDDDFKLLRGFIDRQTNGQTNKWTFVNVESLSRLKKSIWRESVPTSLYPLPPSKVGNKIERNCLGL